MALLIWLGLLATSSASEVGAARAAVAAVAAPSEADQAPEAASLDRVDGYVALALAHHPDLVAAHARWEAAVHRIAAARSQPQPVVGLGAYVQAVETRVGPQQARLSLTQGLSWSALLGHAGTAAAREAVAEGRRFDAVALGVAADVHVAWWSLWELRQVVALHREHLEVLASLSETLRARVEVGQAGLAGLQQVDLARARLADQVASLQAREAGLAAALRAAIGVPGDYEVPTEGEGMVRPVGEELQALRDAAAAHPAVDARQVAAEAAEALSRARGAARWPGVSVGADWIRTGPASPEAFPMGVPADSGRDAVMARVGLTVPLWQGALAHQVEEASSLAAARRAEARSEVESAWAELEALVAEVDDAARRHSVVVDTLQPQADAAYAAALGAVASGTAPVADVLWLQRDLLDLGVQGKVALAAHQRAWARLEALVGRPVQRQIADGAQGGSP